VQVEDLKLSYGSTSQGDSLQRLADSSAKETAESAGRDRTLKTALRKFKKAYVTDILQETSWNQTETSKILGIQRTYVSRLLNELHIRDSKY
jgi:Nif-specific regulatory protein